MKNELEHAIIEKLVNEMKASYNQDAKYIIFEQLWGSTACGYGTIGGSAMTLADTLIVYIENGPARVYFGSERLAYEIKAPNKIFWDDAKNKCMAPDYESIKYFQ